MKGNLAPATVNYNRMNQTPTIKRLIVTGGAGYIGSHLVKLASAQGVDVHVVDDLSTGFADAIPTATLHRVAIQDHLKLVTLLAALRPCAVVHFAGSISVGESVVSPLKYYEDNVSNTIILLRAMHAASVKKFVFSSSAAVYGTPTQPRLSESHPLLPINPYGHSKLMIEQVLADCAKADVIDYCALRYFNAAGAFPDASLGERHDPETHLIPLVIRAALNGGTLSVFGDDYDTHDGTCVRDYVHVCDLANAHLAAVTYLQRGGQSRAFNLGTGGGHSIREVIAAVEKETGKQVRIKIEDRRIGDPARLVADATSARVELNWNPTHSEITEIIATAVRWERRELSSTRLLFS